MKNVRGTAWQYWRLARGDRPAGFGLLLAPVLWSLWLAASGMPSLFILGLFVAGTWVMRAAGCVINDIADRNIDSHVPRTAARPLAANTLELRHAFRLFGALLIIALLLVLQTNTLTIALSPIALLLTVIYPFSKRVFHAPQLVLALCFSLAVPMSFAAVQGQLPPALWHIWLINILWVLVYDTFYAMSDRLSDQKLNIHSTALLLGNWDRTFIALLQCIIIALLLACAHSFHLGYYYFAGVAAMGVLFVYQQWLVREREPRACMRAFVSNVYAGMAVFAGIVIDLYGR